jgi:ABC-type maltose transport system permease subunit
MTAQTITVSGRRTPRWRKILNSVFSYGLLLAVAVFVLLPIIWGLDISLKQEGEYSANPIKWLPGLPYWINYVHVPGVSEIRQEFALPGCVVFRANRHHQLDVRFCVLAHPGART